MSVRLRPTCKDVRNDLTMIEVCWEVDHEQSGTGNSQLVRER
ncbi:MAG: hypothetical protein K0S45_1857 [Nitrospira sp.]|jgi:hypothetical protein|nr:hypothetical protein [Nitrospira sp.]